MIFLCLFFLQGDLPLCAFPCNNAGAAYVHSTRVDKVLRILAGRLDVCMRDCEPTGELNVIFYAFRVWRGNISISVSNTFEMTKHDFGIR